MSSHTSYTLKRLAPSCVLLAGVILLSPPPSAYAATIFYDDTGGNFGDGPSWAGGVAPGPADTAVIDTGDPSLLLSFFANRTIQALDIQDVDVTFDLSGFDLNITGFGGLDVGVNADTSSSATFKSNTPGSVVSVTRIDVRAPANETADLLLTGSNISLIQTSFDSINIGDNFGGGASTFSIQDGASFTTGTGILGIGASGRVDVGGTALLTVNGNLLVDGGDLDDLDGDNFVWAVGRTMTVENGGAVRFTGSGFDIPSGAQIIVSGSGSRVTGAGNFLGFDGTASISVSDGGEWNRFMYVEQGSSVTVDGAGSRLGGFELRDGDVTLSNGALASSTFINIGGSGAGSATLNVFTGSTVNKTSSSNFTISDSSGDTPGTVNVQGGGSSVTVVNAAIGSSSGSTGTLNVDAGGSYIASSGTRLNATGTINITNGTALLGDFTDNGGTINFNSGTFGHNGDATIGAGSFLGSSISTSSKSLIFGGTITVDAGASLSVNGGILSAGDVANFGNFSFTSGTLEITNSDLDIDTGGLLGRVRTISSDEELVVTQNLNVANTGRLLVSRGRVSAGTINNDGTLELGGFGSVVVGGLIVNDSIVTGSGVIDSTLQNNAAGEVRIDSFDDMDFTAPGNTNDGLIYSEEGILRFSGGLTNNPSGVISARGPLRFTGGLTNAGDLNFGTGVSDVFGEVTNTSQGQISAAGGSNAMFFGEVVNAGDVFVGFDSRVTFFGDVSGAGSFSGTGIVEFTDGFSPGASPAIVTFDGDVALAGSTDLLIELGGLIPGGGFDQLDIAGDITLDGVLNIALINGFTPGPGDTFQIINAATRAGEFDSITGNDLGGGVMLDVVYSATGVMLQVTGGLAGDLDGDGFVGINDLNIVLGNWNQNVPPADPLADPSGDGFVGINDLNTVLSNWNAGTPPPPGTANIPEPGTLILLGLSGVAALCRSRA